ncbi:MAG: hypothetical protein R3B82_00950 [Sandaracinaceae bacterium]
MSGYPLEAAKTLRASERERAERALADRERELSEARAGTQAARDALAAHRERMAARRAPAPTTGAALQREQAFLDRLRAEEEALRKALTDQAARERAAARSVRAARAALGRAHVDEEVVARHEERWRGERKRTAERAAEEELEEIRRA